jgi:TPR repeat protein
MYETGRGVARDDTEAVRWYRRATEQDYAWAQNNLGAMYQGGKGVPKDEAQALRWYRRAAERGYVAAYNNLGEMYAAGLGVPKDYAEAASWFRKGAEKGDAASQTSLGYMYALGLGVGRDPALALEWTRKAVEQSHAKAQSNLGWLYHIGIGVEKDFAQAMHWYRKAADGGDSWAEWQIAYMYQQGQGVPKDDALALEWTRKAAEKGVVEAEKDLGFRYREGWGVAEDLPTALKWMEKAAAKGDKQAQEFVERIAREARHEGVAIAPAPKAPTREANVARMDALPDIPALVKAQEKTLPVLPVPNEERMALALQLTEALRSREKLARMQAENDQLPMDLASGASAQLLEAFRDVAQASFGPESLLPIYERKLAELLDPATLRAGIEWERSETGRRINELEIEKPKQRAAYKDFARQFLAKGGAGTNDPRGRACSQVDILRNRTEATLPTHRGIHRRGRDVDDDARPAADGSGGDTGRHRGAAAHAARGEPAELARPVPLRAPGPDGWGIR